jgi:hypothetical protein
MLSDWSGRPCADGVAEIESCEAAFARSAPSAPFSAESARRRFPRQRAGGAISAEGLP